MSMEQTLRRWIRDHKICWELSPLVEMPDHQKVQVGYELRLFARHTAGVKADPGCHECVDLFEKLRAIAMSVLPREVRPTTYDVESFDASWHLRPETQWTPEVQLVLRIVHRGGYFRPADPCESRCAKEIQDRLRELGAQEKVWTDRPQRSPSIPSPLAR